MPEVEYCLPLRFGIGLRHARIYMDARHLHRKIKMRLAHFGDADHGCGRSWHRRACQRNMSFTCQQAGGRIQSDPTGARNIDFSPRMKVGEVVVGAGRAVECFHIGLQLDQITRSKTRSKAQVTQGLNQQPGRVPA